jgi:hypothetical protein
MWTSPTHSSYVNEWSSIDVIQVLFLAYADCGGGDDAHIETQQPQPLFL